MQDESVRSSRIQQISNKIFASGVILLLLELLVCLVYGLQFGYSNDVGSQFQKGHLIILVLLTILATVGFGLMNTYITNYAFSALSLSTLLFAITLQHYFLVRVFWYKTGLSNAKWSFNQGSYNMISLSKAINSQNSTPVDAVICSICIILAFSSAIGRTHLLEIIAVTLLSTFFYELNNQIFTRLSISDAGYGMRLFLMAGALGSSYSFITSRRSDSTTETNTKARYYSEYKMKGIALFGFLLAFCLMPYLSVASLYHTNEHNAYILFIVPLNMYLALGAGTLGVFAGCTLVFRKMRIFQLVFVGLNGGIAFSSSCNLIRNPAVPLAVGFGVGVCCSIYHSKIFSRLNQNIVVFSLPTINSLLVPGIISGFLSAILISVSDDTYVNQVASGRSPSTQAGFQVLGVVLSLGIGLIGGAGIALLSRLIPTNSAYEYFNDNALFVGEKRPEDSSRFKSFRETQ